MSSRLLFLDISCNIDSQSSYPISRKCNDSTSHVKHMETALIIECKECTPICVKLIQDTKCSVPNDYQSLQSKLLPNVDYDRNIKEIFSPANQDTIENCILIC